MLDLARRTVVYFDQILGAGHTRKLVELLFSQLGPFSLEFFFHFFNCIKEIFPQCNRAMDKFGHLDLALCNILELK